MNVTDKHKTVAWRGGIGAAMSILAFLGIYIFNTVTAIPETYPTKSDVDKRISRDLGHMQDRQDMMQAEVKEDLKQIIQNQNRIKDAVESINKYLLDHN